MIKARYGRTNFRDAEAQLVKIDIIQTWLRLMAYELRHQGVTVPGADVQRHHDASTAHELLPGDHHKIAREEHARNTLVLGSDEFATALPELTEVSYISGCPVGNDADPLVQEFVPLLKTFALTAKDNSTFRPDEIVIEYNKVYRHKTAHFNFTTYDVRRDQTTVHPSEGRVGVMVSIGSFGDKDPWVYAWVLGVFHANVLYPDSDRPVRLDFLWVRWMERVPSTAYGSESLHLERLHFADMAPGFVHLTDIIRGAHFLPAFHYGPANPARADITREVQPDGWHSYYMNRYAMKSLLTTVLFSSYIQVC